MLRAFTPNFDFKVGYLVGVERFNLCRLIRFIISGRTLGPDFHLNVVYVVCVDRFNLSGLVRLLC